MPPIPAVARVAGRARFVAAVLLLSFAALLSGCGQGSGAAVPAAAAAADGDPPARVEDAATPGEGDAAAAGDEPLPAEEVALDAPWPTPDEVERDGPDAELAVRIGDIDNFGYGFPTGFDPFSGRSTSSHGFPFKPEADDAPGTDRIMVPSGHRHAGGDGYTGTTRRPDNQPVPLRVAFDLDGVEVRRAALQLFVDDFQAPRWNTRFQAKVNGMELPMLATMLNALDQTGPIGKLVTIELLPEQLAPVREGRLEIEIDDPQNDVADGYAFDFVRLLVNPKPWRHAGTVRGIAVDRGSGEPLAGVLVSAGNTSQASSGGDGRFVLEQVPAGLAVVSGSHPDYLGDSDVADLVAGGSAEVRLELEPTGKTAESLGEQLDRQGHVDLYGIYFDTDKAVLKEASTEVLEQVLALLQARPTLRLQVGGHTDAEGGDAHNQSLSERRAAAVVAWLVEKGVDPARLASEGFGESRPVANNDSAEGRALNRRVEVRRAD